jgi:hypothetical protein
MVGWGILLLLLGIGSLLLPMLNMQFRLMELLDPYQGWAGIAVAVIGAVLVFMGQTRGRSHGHALTARAAARAGRTSSPALKRNPRRPSLA